jgi:GH35 family endo-1,4-beta-xylanase
MESKVITKSLMECAKTKQTVINDYSFENSNKKTQNVTLTMEYLQEIGNKHILLGTHKFKN